MLYQPVAASLLIEADSVGATVSCMMPVKPANPPEIDGGIYLLEGGKAIDEPAQMLLIKNDPKYNEQRHAGRTDILCREGEGVTRVDAGR